MKPLFIPLKTKYFESFEDGSKKDELRLYGPRWNERTCIPGRDVVLSKGYGKGHRMTGTISTFSRQHGTTFGGSCRTDILDVFGTLNIEIAVIHITVTAHLLEIDATQWRKQYANNN